MEKLYTAEATVQGGRNGHVKSSDGVIDMDLRTPKEMGGPGGHATNPEQLFAAGYASCFDGALNLVARTKKIKLEGSQVTGKVSFNKESDGGFKLSVELDVEVKGVDYATAKQLVDEAHQVCPYSKATRGNIDVELKVVEAGV